MKFIILGCGSSMGVPRADGFFGSCNPKNPKNYRTRCSALIVSNYKKILIDTSPDLRIQLLKNKIKNIDTVVYSHNHADQTHGINDLRTFSIINRNKIPVYADKITKKYLSKSFSYCFNKIKDYPPTLKLFDLKKNLNFGKSIKIETVKVKHGSIESLAFIINKKIAYMPDVNEIYQKDYKKFKNLKYLVIDCLRFKSHPSHLI